MPQCRMQTHTRLRLLLKMERAPWVTMLPSPSAGVQLSAGPARPETVCWAGACACYDWSVMTSAPDRGTCCRLYARYATAMHQQDSCSQVRISVLSVYSQSLMPTRRPWLHCICPVTHGCALEAASCQQASADCHAGYSFTTWPLASSAQQHAATRRLYTALGRQLDERSVLLLYNLLHSCPRFRNYLHVCG